MVSYLGSLVQFSPAAGRVGAAGRHRCVWGALAVFRPHWACPAQGCLCFPVCTAQAPGRSIWSGPCVECGSSFRVIQTAWIRLRLRVVAARAAEAGEDTTRRFNRTGAFAEDPKTGPALSAGPAPYRAAGSLSSADGESTDTPERANQVWPEHGESSPHTATSACSAALPAAGLN